MLKLFKSHAERVNEQIAQYKNVENMHQQLSPIFHYWQQKHFRPKFVAVTGCQNFIEFYGRHLKDAVLASGLRDVVSIGSGDADVEIRVANWLRKHGCTNFRIVGLELSPYQIKRAWDKVDGAGLRDNFDFLETDFNLWDPPATAYAGFIAHHALHHVLDLEHLFSAIKRSMHPDGTFVSFDVIGRNGHMRWPEALAIVERIWAFLPPERRYHQILKVTDDAYVNRDCSTEGFEGIRSQDILPLLTEHFHFKTFLGFGNLVDMFTSRGYGPNWNADDPRDQAFIDFIQYLDELLVDLGHITPTRMCAAMTLRPAEPKVYRNWTPEHCVRRPDAPGLAADATPPESRPARALSSGPDHRVAEPPPAEPRVASMTGVSRLCPVCDTPPGIPDVVGQSPARMPGLEVGSFDFMHCRRCGLYFLSPLPTAADFQKMYSGENWKPLDGKEAPIALTYFQNRLKAMAKQFGFDLGQCKVLEIGAGYAWMARAAKQLNPRVHTVAQDINPAAVKYCSWVDRYVNGKLEDVIGELANLGPYTLISMTHVVEHLPQPRTVLRTLRSLLDKRGVLFVTAPYRPKNWDSHSPFPVWKNWQFYLVPGHLQFFDETTLGHLGRDAGLSLKFFSSKPGGGEAFEAWFAPESG